MPLAWIRRLGRRVGVRKNRVARQRIDFVRLGIARLEDRVVLDGAGVVADLQPGTGGSNPSQLTEFNGSYYFTADGTDASGQSVGRELFRLDADGSVSLVADINPGAAGSDPGDFALFDPNGTARLLFAATGPQGRELYQLDTNGNVSLVFDVNPGPGSSDPVMLTEYSGKLYFTAFTPATGREAYVVNNGGNVSLIADLNPGAASSDPSALFEFGGNLYFSAEVDGSRYLFREAPSGTSDPVQVDLGAGVTDPRDFVTFNDRLYFSALDPADGRELFAMSVANNGRETVTKVANLDGTAASSSPSDFFVFGDHLYFSADGPSGRELFRLDTAGNIAQLDLAAGPASSAPSGFALFQGQMYFAATVDGVRGLWRLDTSTSALAAVQVPLPVGVTLPQEVIFYALAEELFFAGDGPAGRELYRLDAAGTVSLAADVNPGSADSDPADVILFGGKVYFVATEAGVGRELFVLRRDPSSVRVEDGKLIFNDDDGDNDNRLVVSSTGTHLVIVDENGHSIALLTSLAGATGGSTSQVAIPLSSLAGVTQLDIFTRGGNDSVTFDLSSNADSLLGQFTTSTYDGGTNSATGDKLRFVGDGVTSSVYTPDAMTTGSGVVVVSSPAQSLTFAFLALEPVDFTGMAEAKLVTPATASGADNLTILAGVDSLDGFLDALIVSGTVGGTLIESAYFFGNDSVVIVTSSGVDGQDSVQIVSAANDHDNTHLTIDTGPLGQDSVQIAGTVTSDGSLQIDTAALSVLATISLGGSATFTTRGDTTFGSAGTLFSPQVMIEAGGAISLADGALIDAGAGTIGLVAQGDITLGRLVTTNSTPLAISITSLSGSILDGGDSGGANVVAEGLAAVVTLSAAQGVGSAASPLDLAVRHLVATSGGDQHLNELDDLDSLNLNAGAANIHLTAGGRIQDGDGTVDIAAAGLAVVAQGVGTLATPLQFAVANLEAEVGAGGLFVTDSGGLELGGVSADIKGVHTNDGPLRIVAGPILVSEGVGASGGGTVELLASGDIRLAALVDSESGDVTLAASGDILAGPSGGLATSVGTLLLWADSDNAGGGTIQFDGNIDVGDGRVIFRFPDADGLLSGVVRGQGSVVKQGKGTLTLTATSINTYTGTTELLGGTLQVDGAIGAAGPAGTFFLAGGTTLTGGGDINAPIFSRETSSQIVSLGDLTLGDNSTAGFDFAGRLLVASGDDVTLRDADLAQLGVLTMIADGGRLIAPAGVEVDSGERLAGSGAVSGNVMVLAGGQVSPGASTGVVSTAKGDVMLQSGAIYVVEINGTSAGSGYDQLNVQGTVDLSGAVLSLGGGAFRPPTGSEFTLIENDGTDDVRGQFAGLGEGATVRFGGIEATISYSGGTGNDVTLTVTELKIIRTITSDVVVVRVGNESGGGTSYSQRATAAPVILTESNRAAAVAQSTDVRPQALETRSVERLRVFLKVVDEVTLQEEGKEVELNPRVLDDVLGFFQRYRFPNGRYRIYLQEAGKSPRVIIDITIRDGRAVSPEAEQVRPPDQVDRPAPQAPAEPAAPAPEAEATSQTAFPSMEAGESSTVAASGPRHRWSAASAPLAASLAVAAAPQWRRRISQWLAQSGRIPRTRFHRRRFINGK